MSEMRVYDERQPTQPLLTLNNSAEISKELRTIGVQFKHWAVPQDLDSSATQDEVIEACRDVLNPLMDKHGFKSMDVISLSADHPDKDTLRDKFLHEHTHDDFELRFFVDGSGLFNIHHENRVYAVLCERGDLISVPAGTRHWFDMGPQPYFKAIRLFTADQGWVANFTGDDIADQFPRLEAPHYDAAA